MGNRKQPNHLPPPGSIKPPPPPAPPRAVSVEAERRYLHDPVFHAAVHVLTELMVTHSLTREQLVQAVDVAAVRAQMIQYDRLRHGVTPRDTV